MILTLSGVPSSKKNSKRIVRAGARPFLVSSEAYQAWHEAASYELQMQIRPLQWADLLPCKDVRRIVMEFWPKDKRRHDLTNVSEGVMDLLVEHGVLKDDNWWEVPLVTLERRGVDNDSPRVRIHIHSNA